LWNSLPEVVSAATVGLNSFKARLDRFWANEEIYYNYKLSCTGSRSNYDVDLE